MTKQCFLLLQTASGSYNIYFAEALCVWWRWGGGVVTKEYYLNEVKPTFLEKNGPGLH